MRGASQPDEAVHSMESMWSVKLRPKINSAGGMRGLGVVVLSTVRAEESMFGRAAIEASSDWMLYGRLWECHCESLNVRSGGWVEEARR